MEVTRVVRVTFNTYSTDDYRIHAPKHNLYSKRFPKENIVNIFDYLSVFHLTKSLNKTIQDYVYLKCLSYSTVFCADVPQLKKEHIMFA